MDVFPSESSSRLVAVSHPGKWEPFESLMQQGRIQAFISFMEPTSCRIFHQPVQEWVQNQLYVANFKRVVKESKKVNYFNPRQVKWAKVCKKLRSSPQKCMKNSDQRMNFKLDTLFLVKQYFSFGLWKVPANQAHVFQTSDVPMLVYELQPDCMACTPKPITDRRSLAETDECYYKRFVLRPNSAYVVPPGTQYLILTVQKTLFGVDVMPYDQVRDVQDFRTYTDYTMAVYNLPPPTPRREEERPKMIRPEDRLARKRQRVHEPVVVAAAPVSEESYAVESPMPQEQVLVFHEPVEEPTHADLSMPNWDEILHADIPPETISDFLNNFENDLRGMCEEEGLELPIPMDASNNIPSCRVMHVSGVLPPPPPKEYFMPYQPEQETLNLEDIREEALDLSSKHKNISSAKTHVFTSEYPLNLSVKSHYSFV